jgi:hypothetical protein
MESASGSFEVPYSSGYQTYSGLLSIIDSIDQAAADSVHAAQFSGLTNSGLLSDDWGSAKRDYHNSVRDDPDSEYTLKLGVTHPSDRDVFESLMRAFVIEDRNLPLAHGELSVTQVSTDRATHQELIDRASDVVDDADGVQFTFESPACRQRFDGVWEATPHRVALFQHILDRWNASLPDDAGDIELSVTDEMLGEGLYPRVETDSYRTMANVVYRSESSGDAEGESETDSDAAANTDGTTESASTEAAATDGGRSHAQGYIGEWEWRFKDTASEATRIAVLTAAQFAEFAGVGRHNARGAGCVETAVLGADI